MTIIYTAKSVEWLYWQRLTVLKELADTAEKFSAINNVCNSSSMHVRKTDLEAHLFHRKRTNLRKFEQFIESRPAAEKVKYVFIFVDSGIIKFF